MDLLRIQPGFVEAGGWARRGHAYRPVEGHWSGSRHHSRVEHYRHRPLDRFEHQPFHEHLGASPNSGYGGSVELWRLLAQLNFLAREAERIVVGSYGLNAGRGAEHSIDLAPAEPDAEPRDEPGPCGGSDRGSGHAAQSHAVGGRSSGSAGRPSPHEFSAAYGQYQTSTERLIDAVM